MERPVAARPSEHRSMDFVPDALTLVDNHIRGALAIVVDAGIRGEHAVEAVESVATRRGRLD
jgi:putative transposase